MSIFFDDAILKDTTFIKTLNGGGASLVIDIVFMCVTCSLRSAPTVTVINAISAASRIWSYSFCETGDKQEFQLRGEIRHIILH